MVQFYLVLYVDILYKYRYSSLLSLKCTRRKFFVCFAINLIYNGEGRV
jgi:hypothetical protein